MHLRDGRGAIAAGLLPILLVLGTGAAPAGAAKPATPRTGGVLATDDVSPKNLPDVGGTVTFTATDVRNATAGCQLRVAGVTSLLRGVTVKGAAVSGTPVRHGSNPTEDFAIAQNAPCPHSVTATAVITHNTDPSRAHLAFTLRLYSHAVDKRHQAVTALRSFGAQSVGVAPTRNVVVRDVTARPSVLTNWSAGGPLQVAASVANAQSCTVTSQVVDTGGTPAVDAVGNLKAFESLALAPGVPVDCSAAGTATPARVTAGLTIPAVGLAHGATCGYVKLDVTVRAKGNGSPRAGSARVIVSSGGPYC